ncbi:MULTISPECIES: outer membrane lipoprotein-sorting protein [Hydrocarboniphaga]|nr:outer membrane lipoprotein-sorting protein [Hydrocarboniphaga sp.]
MILILASLNGVAAQTPEQAGLSLAQEANQRDSGFGDVSVEMLMILRNPRGQESTRRMHSRILEVPSDGERSLILFDDPGDVRGTALLTHSHSNGQDDRWLYMPAAKRVKRIVTGNKTGPFMGSEFAFEDIGSQHVAKYRYRLVGEEACGSTTCRISERIPNDSDSAYSRQKVWTEKLSLSPMKIEFYDRKQSLLKTLVFEGYKQYSGKYWRADRLVMTNNQSGAVTTLIFNNYHFANGYNPRDFEQSSLGAGQ